jgi:hypothetical protein
LEGPEREMKRAKTTSLVGDPFPLLDSFVDKDDTIFRFFRLAMNSKAREPVYNDHGR